MFWVISKCTQPCSRKVEEKYHLKKNAQQESCELFYWGQNKDCSPGDSTSGSSEKLSKEAARKDRIYLDFGYERVHAIKLIFFQELSASRMKLSTSHQNSCQHEEFYGFLDMRRYKYWGLIKSAPEKYLSEDLPCQFFAQNTVPPWFSSQNSLQG